MLLGYDGYDSSSYLTRDIANPMNSAGFTWGPVTRATVQAPQVVDTSKIAQDGGVGDAVDAVGFLQSDKTDSVFAMYRVDNAAVTYTFDVAGYTNLSVSMDWACSGNMPDLGVSVGATLDGGASQKLFEIGSSDGSVTYEMEDGRQVAETKYATVIANGVTAGVLRNNFQRFEATVGEGGGGGGEATTDTGGETPASGCPGRHRVFLLGGQSNMLGYGVNSDLNAPYNTALPAVRYWHNRKWFDLRPGFGRAGGFGPEVMFGHVLRKARQSHVIIKTAQHLD